MTKIETDYQRPKSEKRKGACQVILRQGARTKMILLPVKVYAHEWDAENGTIRVEGAPASRLKELLRGKALIEEEIAMLTDIVEQLENGKQGTAHCRFSEILRQHKYRKLERSFFLFMEHRIADLSKAGQDSTAENYQSAFGCFREFRRKKDLAISDLTGNIMQDFQKYMKRKGLAMNTISLYNRNLRAAYNYALDEGLLREDRRPFCKVFTGQEKTRKRAVKADIVKRLIRLPLEGHPELVFARDIFLFCIYTRGMAFVDVAHLTATAPQGQTLVYKRSKTGQQLEVELPKCALEIIARYKEPGNPYLFPILHNVEAGKTTRYRTALREYNRRLHRLSDRLGMEKPLSSYVARHTWASLAKWNGVSDSVISEAMGHANIMTTIIYLASLDADVISAANHTVLASLMK